MIDEILKKFAIEISKINTSLSKYDDKVLDLTAKCVSDLKNAGVKKPLLFLEEVFEIHKKYVEDLNEYPGEMTPGDIVLKAISGIKTMFNNLSDDKLRTKTLLKLRRLGFHV